METNETKMHCEGCKHPECHCDNVWAERCGHHRLTHLIIKVLAIALIFWCGMQFGEIESRFHHRYGGYQMMQSYGGDNWEYRVTPMMKGSALPVTAPSSATSSKK